MGVGRVGMSMAGVLLGMHKSSPKIMLGAGFGFFFVGVAMDVNGPRFYQEPERMAEKWNGLRKALEK